MPDARVAVLLSVRPKFARALMSGDKTVELRRTLPRLPSGSVVVVYASSPTRALLGTVRLDATHVGTIEETWRLFGRRARIDRTGYDSYFDGAQRAIALEVSQPDALAAPRSLRSIQAADDTFRPPQSFRYLTAEQLAWLVPVALPV